MVVVVVIEYLSMCRMRTMSSCSAPKASSFSMATRPSRGQSGQWRTCSKTDFRTFCFFWVGFADLLEQWRACHFVTFAISSRTLASTTLPKKELKPSARTQVPSPWDIKLDAFFSKILVSNYLVIYFFKFILRWFFSDLIFKFIKKWFFLSYTPHQFHPDHLTIPYP